MAKSGQARVIAHGEFDKIIENARKHRHPEKNVAILYVSFKLGLRAQEMALLELKEVCRLDPASADGFILNEIMPLPARYTKGSNAVREGTDPIDKRRVFSFKKDDFDKLVRQVEERAKNNLPVKPEDYYPPARSHKGKSRDLPMVDPGLREALTEYLRWRMEKYPKPRKTDPLFISQKESAYSPNSMQRHIGTMLKEWSGIERASSHSGRRTLLTNIVHETGDIKVAQVVAGHVDPATTLIYTEPREFDVARALVKVGKL